jgi:hypothetical protein
VADFWWWIPGIIFELSDQKAQVFLFLIVLMQWFFNMPVRCSVKYLLVLEVIFGLIFYRHSLTRVFISIESCFRCDSMFSNAVHRASNLSIGRVRRETRRINFGI